MRKTFLFFAMMMAVAVSAQTNKAVKPTPQTTSAKTTTDKIPADKTPEGVEAVDLGLPSGTLWASRNVGAATDDRAGIYVAWGETTPNNSYSWTAYKFCKGKGDKLTKYNNDTSYGVIDKKHRLVSADDAARTNWGGKWRMPTEKDVKELIAGTKFRAMTSENGINGVLLTSKVNGNSIFLPAGGYRDEWASEPAGSAGYYWTASVEASCAGDQAITIFMDARTGCISTEYAPRKRGLNVRPVMRK